METGGARRRTLFFLKMGCNKTAMENGLQSPKGGGGGAFFTVFLVVQCSADENYGIKAQYDGIAIGPYLYKLYNGKQKSSSKIAEETRFASIFSEGA